MSALLLDFVKDASRLGKSREEINTALQEAGWQEDQLTAFWANYSATPFAVPVPKPTLHASPRITTLNLFFFIVLYTTFFSAVSMIFVLLDYHLPNGRGEMAGTYYSSEPIADTLRGYLAALFASLPLVFFSARQLRKIIATSRQPVYVVRLRLINLTLLIAALVAFCESISFIYYFLNGELGIRFMVKVAVITLVSVGTYFYFKPEINAFEKKA